MYTQNLVLFTQEIIYGESLTSFSNFKGLLKHRKNAGLFINIHCGVVAKSIQTIAISLLFLQKCRFLHKKRKGQLWGILRPPRTKLWSFFLFIMAIWTFFDNFYPPVALWVTTLYDGAWRMWEKSRDLLAWSRDLPGLVTWPQYNWSRDQALAIEYLACAFFIIKLKSKET